MDYLKFLAALKSNGLQLFSLRDVENIFPESNKKTIKNNLINWLNKGYIRRLKRNLYEYTEPGAESRLPDLYIANNLYSPSYISLETALSFYNIIPETTAQVTSVTTKPTREFRNSYGVFVYHSCKKRAFAGYRIIMYERYKIAIADREKALVDFLYFRLRRGISLDFREERFDKKILKKLEWNKAIRYAKLFNIKTAGAVTDCKGWAKC